MNSQIKFWILLGIGVASVSAFAVLGYFPITKRIDTSRQSMDRVEQEVNASIQQIRSIPAIRQQCTIQQSRIDGLKKKLLMPDSISRAMNALTRLCSQYQIRLTKINFSTDSLLARSRSVSKTPSESFELPIFLECEGSYLDFGMMSEHLNQLNYAIGFSDLNITTQEKGDRLKFYVRAWVRIASMTYKGTVSYG